MDGYVTKPVGAGELLAALAREARVATRQTAS
jgi:hypothetical protein